MSGFPLRALSRGFCLVLIIQVANGWSIEPSSKSDETKGATDAKGSPESGPHLLTRFQKGSMSGVDEIVFAVRQPGKDGHWYANFGYYAESAKKLLYGDGGRLCRLHLQTGKVVTLLDDPAGGVRDPIVHYDATRILFSYRKGGTPNYHLYEINVDGSGLRQLTDGPYDDIEPTYLPDDRLLFISSRCNRWVNCWLTQVASMYVCDQNGNDIRPISANIEHDNTPWLLPDGRVLYQRWEYVDRSQVNYHHLWTSNPDGTMQTVFYGNMHPGILMIDAKPIPNSRKVVAIFSPGHGRKEHAGALTLVDPAGGPDDLDQTKTILKDPIYRDPWAFSEQAMMVARETEILLVDGQGSSQVIYRLADSDRKKGLHCHEPRPLMPRKREPMIGSRVALNKPTGRLVLSDVNIGRNMQGVKPGEIKKLLVLETLPKPINYTGGMDPLTYGGSFTLERVLGTVPVESDGSAYMELPALRGLFFVALDADDMAVKRMQSFLTVQPGEVTSCIGCHEQRTQSVPPRSSLLALQRPPSQIEPVSDCPDVLDFPRDIQPILDRVCVDCHGYQRTDRGGPRDGGVLLTGDHGPMFSHAYFTMTVKNLFTDGRDRPESNLPPRAIGSAASRILGMMDGSHFGATATKRERKIVRIWTEVGAPYPGTYGALGGGAIGGYYQNKLVNTDTNWPTTGRAAAVMKQRCAECHRGQTSLPLAMSDELDISFWYFDIQDPRLRFSRHILFNLSRPAKSLILLAPLSQAAGGWGLCRTKQDQPATVFEDTDDPGYQKLLAMVAAGKANLEKIKRFDMPGFQPPRPYVREMVRYGILPPDQMGQAVDSYRLDRQYWRSLWYRPR